MVPCSGLQFVCCVAGCFLFIRCVMCFFFGGPQFGLCSRPAAEELAGLVGAPRKVVHVCGRVIVVGMTGKKFYHFTVLCTHPAPLKKQTQTSALAATKVFLTVTKQMKTASKLVFCCDYIDLGSMLLFYDVRLNQVCGERLIFKWAWVGLVEY